MSARAEDAIVPRLPLPLARLHHRAVNARSVEARYATAWHAWEAGLKTIGAVAVAAFAAHPDPDPALADRLRCLARPSTGDWVGLIRALVPVLAGRGHAGFAALLDQIYGRSRDDLPRAAGLAAALAELRGEPLAARATVSLAELFDTLAHFRNRELGHGAGTSRRTPVKERIGQALTAGFAETFAAIDPLAGFRLVYLDKVRRAAGGWTVGGVELTGLAPTDFPATGWVGPGDPIEKRMYLRDAGGFVPLHPLLWYDPDAEQVSFLNSRRGKAKVEYLCYVTGEHAEHNEFAADQRDILAAVLGVPVAPDDPDRWAAESLAEEPPAPDATAAVRRLGEFEIEGELGRGGMGIVYRARQPSVDRMVAVKKLFRPGDARAEKRFAREIRAHGKVLHPHLARVYTSGSDGDDWFFAMELVEGATLADVCKHLCGAAPETVDCAAWRAAVSTVCDASRPPDAPPPPAALPPPAPPSPPGRVGYMRQVVGLLAQVADAAHALHERNIIHRDIKPGNVMVSPDGEWATLLDLGLAKLLDEPDGGVTKSRGFVGTPRYASPEQAAGLKSLDRRADVYGLGATLWELLTLRPMHAPDLPEHKVFERVLQKPAEPARTYSPEVPPELEAVVMQCLERDPDARYQTAKALADDLRNWLDGKPVGAKLAPKPVAYKVLPAAPPPKPPRRRMVSRIILTLTVVGCFLGIKLFVPPLLEPVRKWLVDQLAPYTPGTTEPPRQEKYHAKSWEAAVDWLATQVLSRSGAGKVRLGAVAGVPEAGQGNTNPLFEESLAAELGEAFLVRRIVGLEQELVVRCGYAVKPADAPSTDWVFDVTFTTDKPNDEPAWTCQLQVTAPATEFLSRRGESAILFQSTTPTTPHIDDEGFVAAGNGSPYALRVTLEEPSEILQPVLVSSSAVVRAAKGRKYTVRLRNDSGRDVVAGMMIDGVNIFKFRQDDAGRDSGSLAVGAKQVADVRGWYRTLQSVSGFQVAVAPQGGEATKLLARDRSVVTATFADAWRAGDPPAEQPGKTADGVEIRTGPVREVVSVILDTRLPPKREAQQRKVAVIVGVGKYDARALADRASAETDAAELAEFLRKKGDEVILLNGGPGGKRPTGAEILRVLKEVLDKVGRDTLFLFSFTGNGGVEKDGAVYLYPSDARPGDPQTQLPLSHVYASLDKAMCRDKIVLLDADYGTADRNRGAGSEAGSEKYTGIPEGVTLLTSTSPGERPLYDENSKRGLFTQALLEGLGGKAVNRNGRVTIDSLASYVKETVADEARMRGGKTTNPVTQRPMCIGSLSGPTVLIE